MKNYKQILEQMLSESSGPKDNPFWGDATPVATVGIGKDGPKLIGTTRGAIKASRTAAAEGEQIIRDANRPKPGTLVPVNRFGPDGRLLPPDSKNPYGPRIIVGAPEIRQGPAPRPVEVPVTPKPAPKPRLTPLSPEEQFKLDIKRGKYIQPPKESMTMERWHRSPPTESMTMERWHRSPPTESMTMERWHRSPRGRY